MSRRHLLPEDCGELSCGGVTARAGELAGLRPLLTELPDCRASLFP